MGLRYNFFEIYLGISIIYNILGQDILEVHPNFFILYADYGQILSFPSVFALPPFIMTTPNLWFQIFWSPLIIIPAIQLEMGVIFDIFKYK